MYYIEEFLSRKLGKTKLYSFEELLNSLNLKLSEEIRKKKSESISCIQKCIFEFEKEDDLRVFLPSVFGEFYSIKIKMESVGGEITNIIFYDDLESWMLGNEETLFHLHNVYKILHGETPDIKLQRYRKNFYGKDYLQRIEDLRMWEIVESPARREKAKLIIKYIQSIFGGLDDYLELEEIVRLLKEEKGYEYLTLIVEDIIIEETLRLHRKSQI